MQTERRCLRTRIEGSGRCWYDGSNGGNEENRGGDGGGGEEGEEGSVGDQGAEVVGGERFAAAFSTGSGQLSEWEEKEVEGKTRDVPRRINHLLDSLPAGLSRSDARALVDHGWTVLALERGHGRASNGEERAGGRDTRDDEEGVETTKG